VGIKIPTRCADGPCERDASANHPRNSSRRLGHRTCLVSKQLARVSNSSQQVTCVHCRPRKHSSCIGPRRASGVTQGGQSNPQQSQTEFQELGQDLQSGNLVQAQQDYATLSQDFPKSSQSASASNNRIAQAFSSLSQDLQGGNLSAAQQDDATIRQDFQPQGANRPHFDHPHCGGAGGGLGGEEQPADQHGL
jgi:hypothetical protein